MAIRSFLAFRLPEDIRIKLARVSAELKRSSVNARWVKADNIHLTIVFSGDIRQEDILPAGREIGDVCLRYQPFDITLGGIGLFPDRRRPRVVWVGLDCDKDRMSGFRDELQERLVPYGIKTEKRKFQPHLTLGRFRKPERMDKEQENIFSGYADIHGPSGRLDELILFRSDLRPEGAVYTVIDSWLLS